MIYDEVLRSLIDYIFSFICNDCELILFKYHHNEMTRECISKINKYDFDMIWDEIIYDEDEYSGLCYECYMKKCEAKE